MANDFTADSYRVGGIVKALSETIDGQLLFKDADVPEGVILSQLLPDITAMTTTVENITYSVLADISGDIGASLVADISGQVVNLTNTVNNITGDIVIINNEIEALSASFSNLATTISISGIEWVDSEKHLICDLSGNPYTNNFNEWGYTIINISGGVPDDITVGTLISAGPNIVTVSSVDRDNSNINVILAVDGWTYSDGAPFAFNYVNKAASIQTAGNIVTIDGIGHFGVSIDASDAALDSMLTLNGGKVVGEGGQAKIAIRDIAGEIEFALAPSNIERGYINYKDDVNEHELTIGTEIPSSSKAETIYDTSKGEYYWPSYSNLAEIRNYISNTIRENIEGKAFTKFTQNFGMVIGANDQESYENSSAALHIRESDWVSIFGAGEKISGGNIVEVVSISSAEQGRYAWQLRPGDLVQYDLDGEIRTVTEVSGHNIFLVDTPFALSGNGSGLWQAKRHLFMVEGITPVITHPDDLNDNTIVNAGFFGARWFEIDPLGYTRIQNSDTRLGIIYPQLTIANDSAISGDPQVEVAFQLDGSNHHSIIQTPYSLGVLSATGGTNGLHISNNGNVGIGDVDIDGLQNNGYNLNVSGSAWIDNLTIGNLTLSGSSNIEIDLSNITAGTLTVTGNGTFLNNLTVNDTLWTNRLFANSSTVYEHTIMNITSNIIYLDINETGITGVTPRYAGIQVMRGPSGDSYGMLFDELDNVFKVGVVSITGNELIGMPGNDTFLSYLQPVATRTTITENYIPFGNDVNQYTESEALKWANNTLSISGNISGSGLLTINNILSLGSISATDMFTNNVTINEITGNNINVITANIDNAILNIATISDTIINNSLSISEAPNIVSISGISGDNLLDSVNAVYTKWLVVLKSVSGDHYASQVNALNADGQIDYDVFSVLGTGVFNPTIYCDLSGSNLVLKATSNLGFTSRTTRLPISYF